MQEISGIAFMNEIHAAGELLQQCSVEQAFEMLWRNFRKQRKCLDLKKLLGAQLCCLGLMNVTCVK